MAGFDPEAAGIAFDPESAGVSEGGQPDGSLDEATRKKMERLGLPGYKNAPKSYGAAIDLGLEAGLPMAAQALTAEFTPVGMAIAGGAASALGNILAQGRRMMAGEQSGFSFGQVSSSAALGAIPLGPAKAIKAGLAGTLKEVGAEGLKMGAIGYSGEAIKTLVDEGRLPSAGEAAGSAVGGAVLGGGLAGLRVAADGIATKGRVVADTVRDYAAAGVKPSPGMMAPELLARAEQSKVRSDPTGAAATAVNRAKGQIKAGVQGIAPNPQEPAAIFDQASPLLHQISTADEELAKLNETAQKAQEQTAEAFMDLGRARAENRQVDVKAFQAAAEKESDKQLVENFNSIQENAQEIALNRAVDGTKPLNYALARDVQVEHVAKPAVAAKKKFFDERYSLVPNDAPVYDPAPVFAAAEGVASEVTGGLPKKLERSINTIRNSLIPDPDTGMVSLLSLRNAREDILRGVNSGVYESSSEERLMKKVAHAITEQISGQAEKAFGPELGRKLVETNGLYADLVNAMDMPGVDALFSKNLSDAAVQKTLAGMKRSGIQADEYRNVKAVIDKIAALPDSAGQNSQLGATLNKNFNDTLKSAVLFDAAVNNAEGELVVSGSKLASILDDYAKTEGTAEALGFGSRRAVVELKNLFQEYPEVPNMTTSKWEQILSSDAFRGESLGAPWSKSGKVTAVDLPTVMAKAQAEAQMIKSANLKAAGKEDAAKTAYDRALSTLSTVRGDLNAAKAHYEALLQDPVAIAFNNPDVSASNFNSLYESLFDADPSVAKITNPELKAMMSSLRESPIKSNQELLKRFQERFLADSIAAYHSTNKGLPTSASLDTSSLAQLFNPANASDAANLIERAKLVLEPEQMDALAKFAKVTQSIERYEKIGNAAGASGYKPPVYSSLRTAFDFVGDLYRAGKYAAAAKVLAEPKSILGRSARIGFAGSEGVEGATPVLRRAAIAIPRALDNQR